MSSIGITVPVRVCDRCYNDMGGVSTHSSSMTSSFLAVDEDEHTFGETTPKKSFGDSTAGSLDQDSKLEERPERKREKRSLVVDDLANKIRASALSSL
jgi:ribosome-binding protein aMBF1 (putative translation factor)